MCTFESFERLWHRIFEFSVGGDDDAEYGYDADDDDCDDDDDDDADYDGDDDGDDGYKVSNTTLRPRFYRLSMRKKIWPLKGRTAVSVPLSNSSGRLPSF